MSSFAYRRTRKTKNLCRRLLNRQIYGDKIKLCLNIILVFVSEIYDQAEFILKNLEQEHAVCYIRIRIKTCKKSISEVPREVLTSTDNNDDEVLETSTVTNPAQSALSGFLINKKVHH